MTTPDNRKIIFGEYIENPVETALAAVRYKNNIKLSKLGQIIYNQWNNIPKQYNNVQLDKCIIMPNHIHGIIIIHKRTGTSPVSTISNIIGSFKSKTSLQYLQYIKNNNLNISGQIRQRSFHDHIIRTECSLKAIRKYIANNPKNWENDIDNLINL